MEREILIDILKETCRRLAANSNRCGKLIYPQEEDGTSRIREPEARYVLAKVLEEKGHNFMFEAPTKNDYSFTGKGARSAMTDIEIDPFQNGTLNIELKEGQRETIKKDLKKLREESVTGCAIFHILNRWDSGTPKSLLKKYKSALNVLLDDKGSKNPLVSKWIVLFVLVKPTRLCLWRAFSDIAKVNPNKLDIEKFEELKLVPGEENSP